MPKKGIAKQFIDSGGLAFRGSPRVEFYFEGIINLKSLALFHLRIKLRPNYLYGRQLHKLDK